MNFYMNNCFVSDPLVSSRLQAMISLRYVCSPSRNGAVGNNVVSSSQPPRPRKPVFQRSVSDLSPGPSMELLGSCAREANLADQETSEANKMLCVIKDGGRELDQWCNKLLHYSEAVKQDDETPKVQWNNLFTVRLVAAGPASASAVLSSEITDFDVLLYAPWCYWSKRLVKGLQSSLSLFFAAARALPLSLLCFGSLVSSSHCLAHSLESSVLEVSNSPKLTQCLSPSLCLESIGLWKREESGKLCKFGVIHGHEGPVKCLQASPNNVGAGFMLYSGGLDKSIRVWWVPKQDTLEEEGKKKTSFKTLLMQQG